MTRPDKAKRDAAREDLIRRHPGLEKILAKKDTEEDASESAGDVGMFGTAQASVSKDILTGPKFYFHGPGKDRTAPREGPAGPNEGEDEHSQ